MDKKYIERSVGFNQKEYDREYKKRHYKQFTVSLKPELKERIDAYCRKEDITKPEFMLRAINQLENKDNE